MRKISVTTLREKAREARNLFLTIAANTGALHIGSSLSEIDILTVLYASVLRITPETAQDPKRDRFILSKGHAALGWYVILAQHGFVSLAEVERYGKNGTKLAAHPVLGSAPGVEASTGSLGHGLPIALGMAVAARQSGWDSNYYVLLSDGECDEGSNWEALLFAGHLGIGNLTVVVDYNKIQSFGRTADVLNLEPFADKWRAARWHVQEVDGHDVGALQDAFAVALTVAAQPTVIIAHTVKGKGVSYMEDTLEWHYLNLKPADLPKTLEELAK